MKTAEIEQISGRKLYRYEFARRGSRVTRTVDRLQPSDDTAIADARRVADDLSTPGKRPLLVRSVRFVAACEAA